MLLSMEEKLFLSRATKRGKNGGNIARFELSRSEKENLLRLDERFYMTRGIHLIENFEELEQ